jgi:RHS repeat-associated protein
MKPKMLRAVCLGLLAISSAFYLARPAGASVIIGGTPPATGPAPGEQGTALSAGLYTFSNSDFVLAGPLGLKFDRVYRSNDETSAATWNARPFGVGFSLSYDMFLYSQSEAAGQGYSDAELVLPDGGQVYCARTSTCTQNGCTDYTDAVFTCTQGPLGPYYGATVTYDSSLPGWDMTLKDHSIYKFGLGAPMQSVTDRNGNSVTLTRSGGQSGNITQINDSNGRYVDLYYNDSHNPNQITEAVDNSGRTIFYSYDLYQRLTDVFVGSNSNAQQEYAYVNNGNQLGNIQTTSLLESVTSGTANYVATTVSYVSQGGHNFLGTTSAGDIIFGYSYTTNGSLITSVNITDPLNNVRNVQFNSAGYITSDTRASGTAIAETTTYTRDPTSGFITAVTDQLGRETCLAYDSLENVRSVTQLCGGWNGENQVTTSYTYGACSQVASFTDADNVTVSGTFDSNCNLLTLSGGPNGTITYGRNSAGEATSVTDGNNNETTITYNNSLDLATIVDPLQNKFTLTEDGHGNLATITDPYNHSASYSWTGVGQSWSGGIYPDQTSSATNANGATTSVSYEYLGYPTAVTDANNHQTSYEFGGLSGGIVIGVTDPNGNHQSLWFDNEGNLLQYIANNYLQETSYDALGRATEVEYGGTDAGNTITYTYDLGNRMTKAVDTEGGSPSSPGNTITRTYDGLDRVLSETKPEGTVAYSYDPAGLPQTTTAGTQTVAYFFDNLERLALAWNGTISAGISYDAGGRRSSLTLPNGVSEAYSYDADSHVTGINFLENGTSFDTLDYTYDYDSRRLTTYGSLAATAVNLPASVPSATYGNANQLSTWNGTSATDDENNNLTFNPASNDTYTWNPRQELATTSSGYAYYYDAFNRRETVAQGSATTSYLYDGVFPVVTSNSSSGATTYLSAPGGEEQFAITTPYGTTVPIHDALGSTIGLVNGTGALTQLIGYTPYGQASVSSGQFTGQQWDSASGLISFPARYYSPQLQRFLSADPLGFAGGSTNLFQYANSNPVNFVDPLGMLTWPSAESDGGIVGGALGYLLALALGAGTVATIGLAAVGGWLGILVALNPPGPNNITEAYMPSSPAPIPSKLVPNGLIPIAVSIGSGGFQIGGPGPAGYASGLGGEVGGPVPAGPTGALLNDPTDLAALTTILMELHIPPIVPPVKAGGGGASGGSAS